MTVAVMEQIELYIENEQGRAEKFVKEDCEGEDAEYILRGLEANVHANGLPSLERIFCAEEYLKLLRERDYRNDKTLSAARIKYIDVSIKECEEELDDMKKSYKDSLYE